MSKNISMYRIVVIVVSGIILNLTLSYCYADSDDISKSHLNVRKSLVHLTATGTPKTGDLMGKQGGAQSQGTGFIINNEGFILTTEHFLDPLRQVQAKNVSISARVGAFDASEHPVYVVSALPDVDVMLLKMRIPYGTEPPPFLKLGSAYSIDRSTPPHFLTSGFKNKSYQPGDGQLTEDQDVALGYGWTVNIETGKGQSGSPIYLEDETVVGILKGASDGNTATSVMIPIEQALPFTVHLQLRQLSQTLDWALKKIGRMGEDDVPIHPRLLELEDGMNVISEHFAWSARPNNDGSLAIRYEKLVPDGPQIENIKLKLQPFIKEKTDSGVVVKQLPDLNLQPENPPVFSRVSLSENGLVGEFVVKGVQSKLETQIKLTQNAILEEGGRPFEEIVLQLIPLIDGSNLPPTTVNVSRLEDGFRWRY